MTEELHQGEVIVKLTETEENEIKSIQRIQEEIGEVASLFWKKLKEKYFLSTKTSYFIDRRTHELKKGNPK